MFFIRNSFLIVSIFFNKFNLFLIYYQGCANVFTFFSHLIVIIVLYQKFLIEFIWYGKKRDVEGNLSLLDNFDDGNRIGFSLVRTY